MKIRANGIDIEIEDSAHGQPPRASQPVVLLIMGLGMQLVAWPPEMVQGLVDAGFRVIRMDNRDIGLSQHFDHLGKPNLLWASLKYKMGWKAVPPYTVEDMAQDALGVLDSLKVKYAHIVGVSMGGMIAQRVAIAAPKRVLSLTSIMSSSGARHLPKPKPEVLRVMLRRPSSNPAAVIDHYVHLFKAIGSPAYPVAEPDLRTRIAMGINRSFHPVGTLRQMLAIVSDTDRVTQLPKISSRTLVLHGTADPLVPLAHGQDTAERIAGARLVTIDGMGHDLPPEPVRQMLAAMLPHMGAAAPTAPATEGAVPAANPA